MLEWIALWRSLSPPVRWISLDWSLRFEVSEAAVNPVVVLVWHSSVVAAVWHRGQRRCLGGDLTSVLACGVLLDLSETAGLDLKKIKLFVKYINYCFLYIFRASLLGKVCKDFKDGMEPSDWACMMALHWIRKQRAVPAWHQSQTDNLRSISCWPCWGLCIAPQATSEKDFQRVMFGCLRNSSMPSPGGMFRREETWGQFVILRDSKKIGCGSMSVFQTEMLQVSYCTADLKHTPGKHKSALHYPDISLE